MSLTIQRRQRRLARLQQLVESVGWVWDGYDGELDTISPEFIIPKVDIPGYGHHTFDEGLAFAEKWLRRFVRWELDGAWSWRTL